MKIVKLTAENVKRLRAVEIAPSGDMIVVGGKNDAGKSSLLDAIEMAMGGAAHEPLEPVRRGEKAAKVILDLGDLVVTRTWTDKGDRKLVVASKNGAHFPSPQAMLDKLYGALSFDPLAFERMEPKAQAELLRKMVGLDTSDLDAQRVTLYDDRTGVNKNAKALQVLADTAEVYLGAPTEEVSIAAISKEMLRAEDYRRLADDAEREVAGVEAGMSARRTARAVVERQADELERQLADARQRLMDYDAWLLDDERTLEARQITAQAARLVVPDIEPIRARLLEAEGINQQVRVNRQHAGIMAELESVQEASDDLTRRIERIDAARSARIAAAAFPVPGLGVDGDGVVLDGLPFDQASTSDRIRVSVAIGLASNPQLRVLLVRDGSLLGAEKLAILGEMAKAAGAQVWLEMLQDTPDGRTTVYIEDGSVQEPKKRPAMSQAEGI